PPGPPIDPACRLLEPARGDILGAQGGGVAASGKPGSIHKQALWKKMLKLVQFSFILLTHGDFIIIYPNQTPVWKPMILRLFGWQEAYKRNSPLRWLG